ncbi:hypothetical protein E2C01_041348 [Portunus trituberculatus]|uniref:Uncharacterized protein n=1 Tax=Portunus trituberculatus TaxID=210409 RepID=A0A5B7FQH9_PORTR|nr:hypothetical protein [Portunus trituberculatus]
MKAQARCATTQHAHQTHWQLKGRKKQAAWYTAATDYQALDASLQRPWADRVLLQEELYEGIHRQEGDHYRRHSCHPLLHYLLFCPATATLRPAQLAPDQPHHGDQPRSQSYIPRSPHTHGRDVAGAPNCPSAPLTMPRFEWLQTAAHHSKEDGKCQPSKCHQQAAAHFV